MSVLQTTDIAGGSYSLAFFAMLAASVLLLIATSWVSGRWKLSVTLSALTTIIAAVNYYEARGVWLATSQVPLIYHYVGWALTIPLEVIALYFFVRAIGPVSVALFWRLLVVAVVTILARFMGEAGFMHPTLGFLIGIAGWLYLLGEFYFGRLGESVAKSGNEPAQRGYFWLRLIVTIGWAIYPLGNFIASFAGGTDSGSLAIAYNLADLINRGAFGLVIVAVAINHTHPSGAKKGA
ncbi:MAG: bacteriorhodopsin [Devosia nanyangense]|uniref:Bacteriorhodopsin n=1 Tax=Devosia nanyangense TaxID=1228055 RepID=A0A933L6J1_9HYPH|nr:bacteriorhodopsin [Devosia nanyangense]